MMTGIAGFGSCQVYLPGKAVHEFIDFHGKTPAAARPDMWAHLIEGETRDGFGFVLEGRVNDLGYQSITVPGTLKAFHEAQTSYGALPWAQVVQPAIDWAERGWVVKRHVAYWWALEGPDYDYGRVPFILASVAVDFRSEALLYEVLEVGVRCDWIGNKSFGFSYEVREKSDGRVVVTATSVMVCYDYEAKSSHPMPDALRRKLEAFEGRALARDAANRPGRA